MVTLSLHHYLLFYTSVNPLLHFFVPGVEIGISFNRISCSLLELAVLECCLNIKRSHSIEVHILIKVFLHINKLPIAVLTNIKKNIIFLFEKYLSHNQVKVMKEMKCFILLSV
ncbi:hypothetical protein V8G54_031560 [Vigna mungo]|uniref:Uncharacterized protein n=1 Tax=Vigna mungo TaxID=3915 RepID=A0AAQ3RH13_VIGMU